MDTTEIGRGGECALRDEAGLRAAHREHAGELYRFARRQLGDPGAAEDVVQEVFLRAWRSADSFDAARGSLRAWLFTIARNLVVDHARRRAVRPVQPVEASSLEYLAGGDGGFDEATMTAWTVEEALRRLRACCETQRSIGVAALIVDLGR